MTLTEAIDMVNQEVLIRPLPHEEAHNNALKLLIETGKALPQYRNKLKHPELWLLPGETKE